jgi:hypothetical protein
VIVLVSGATVDVGAAPDNIGVLVVPNQGNRIDALQLHRPWAIDNGAYSGLDYESFIELLRDARQVPDCIFVAAPDVPFDASATLQKFSVWGPMIRSLGYSVALVAQDGLTVRMTPWAAIDALFIGGTTEWKMSSQTDTLLAYAAALGKWRHVGRVNSRRRMAHFFGRCDSIDGSGFSKWPKRIKLASRWIQELSTQPALPGVA